MTRRRGAKNLFDGVQAVREARQGRAAADGPGGGGRKKHVNALVSLDLANRQKVHCIRVGRPQLSVIADALEEYLERHG